MEIVEFNKILTIINKPEDECQTDSNEFATEERTLKALGLKGTPTS